jgi:predicted ester cyclase
MAGALGGEGARLPAGGAAGVALVSWRGVPWGGVFLVLGALVSVAADGLFVSLVMSETPVGYNGATDRLWVLADASKPLGGVLVAAGLVALGVSVGRGGFFGAFVWVGVLLAVGPTAGSAGLTLYQYVAGTPYVPEAVGSAIVGGYEYVRPVGILLLSVLVAFGVRGLRRWRVLLPLVGALGLPFPYVFLYRLLAGPDGGWGLVTYWLPQTFAQLGCVLLGFVLLGARGRRAKELAEEKRALEEKNLILARRLYGEVWEEGRLEVVDELATPDLLDSYHGGRGPESLKRNVARLRQTFPDLRLNVEEQSAEGDEVFTRWKMSGTDRGGVLWYPPSGKAAVFGGVFRDRFSDGRLAEHAGEADLEELLRQLGLPLSDG